MTGRRARRPTAAELLLWRSAVRETVPLDAAKERAPEPLPRAVDATAEPVTPPPAPALKPHEQVLGSAGGVGASAIDRRRWQRLRRGQIPIEGKLDLHGLTQAEAHRRLNLFLGRKQLEGARWVLVITGRGLSEEGVLRRMTPRWLDEPPNRRRVVAYASAATWHGGEGALYVLLRRPR